MSDRVICNASPLIFLSKIGRINLLNDLFNKVYVPEGAWNEAIRNPDEMTQELIELQSDRKLSVFEIKNTVAVSVMMGRLHRGEVEVIIGAGELGIPQVILDDGYARNKAKQMGLSVTGTLGILIAAHKREIIIDLLYEIKLLRKVGFRISDAIVEQILS